MAMNTEGDILVFDEFGTCLTQKTEISVNYGIISGINKVRY